MPEGVGPVVDFSDSPEVAEIKGLVPPTAEAKQMDGASNQRVTFSDTQDLKTKAPEVWDAMLEGIAHTIINDMRDHQERLKELNREARRESGG